MAKRKSKEPAAVAVIEPPMVDDTPDVEVPVIVDKEKAALSAARRGKTLDKALKVFAFVKKKPREIQVDAIRRCIDTFDAGADFAVLEAPPGVGKSLIGMALATAYGERAYFTTLTAQLQEQYLAEFAGMGMRALKGRGKFECKRAGESCLVGKELFKDDDACYGPPDPMSKDPTLPHDSAACPYLFSKQSAFNAKYTMANYHSFLANIGQAAMYDTSENDDSDVGDLEGEALLNALDSRAERDASVVKRPFMVLDEAHVIESFLLDQMGVNVNLRKLGVKTEPLPTSEEDLSQYVAWMKATMPALRTREKILSDAQEKEDMRSLIRRIGFVLAKVEKGNSDYVIERDRDSEGSLKPDWFSIKPLRVHEYGHWLWGYGKKTLFMSATVLDPGQLCTNIGLPLERGDFIQMGSVFPKENRPIVVSPLDMRKSNRDYAWPAAAKHVDALLNHHAREKGLLLCPSNEMLKFIADNVSKSNRMRLIFAYGRDRESKYKEHVMGRSPTVLAASGYWEGADLAGDASRFQIIPAAPRPMWHGQIKARTKVDPRWYSWLTYTKLVQGYGRSIRSETDEAITYIFDKEFLDEMNRGTGSMVPPWMKEAVRVVGQKAASS